MSSIVGGFFSIRSIKSYSFCLQKYYSTISSILYFLGLSLIENHSLIFFIFWRVSNLRWHSNSFVSEDLTLTTIWDMHQQAENREASAVEPGDFLEVGVQYSEFFAAPNLDANILRFPPRANRKKSRSSPVVKVNCVRCQKVFSRLDSLRRHQKRYCKLDDNLIARPRVKKETPESPADLKKEDTK